MSCSGSHEARRYRQVDTPTQQIGRKTRAMSERAEASNCTAGDAGNENWEPRCRRLVRRPVESLKGYVTERVAEDTCESKGCTCRRVAGHLASSG